MDAAKRIAIAVLSSVAVMASGLMSPSASAVVSPDTSTSEAGNPFIDGWYADPDVARYGDTYWVYPTSSRPYDEQTYLDAFSSSDLVTWTKHRTF